MWKEAERDQEVLTSTREDYNGVLKDQDSVQHGL